MFRSIVTMLCLVLMGSALMAQDLPRPLRPVLPDFQQTLPPGLQNRTPSELLRGTVESKSAQGALCGRTCPTLCGQCFRKDELFCCEADGGGIPAFPGINQ